MNNQEKKSQLTNKTEELISAIEQIFDAHNNNEVTDFHFDFCKKQVIDLYDLLNSFQKSLHRQEYQTESIDDDLIRSENTQHESNEQPKASLQADSHDEQSQNSIVDIEAETNNQSQDEVKTQQHHELESLETDAHIDKSHDTPHLNNKHEEDGISVSSNNFNQDETLIQAPIEDNSTNEAIDELPKESSPSENKEDEIFEENNEIVHQENEEDLSENTIAETAHKEVEIIQEQTPPLSKQIVSEKYQSSTQALHEKFNTNSADKSIGNRLNLSPLEDLRKAIGINDRFTFINELFQQNKNHFDDFITKISNMSSSEEIISHTEETADVMQWNDKPSYDRLSQLIRRYALTK
jgi:hypothetical protein